MRKVCAKMVPKNLTTKQKANWRDVCLDLLDRLEREPEFFSLLWDSFILHNNFSQSKLDVQLSVKNFLTANQRKNTL